MADREGAGERRAVDAGISALHHRDLSAAQLERRLTDKGFDESEAQDAVAALQRLGLVDDERYAELRAASLAQRGAGDGLVRHELARAGVEADVIAAAITALEPESERALRIAARRGAGPKTARYLHGKGFSEESLSTIVAEDRSDELG